MLQISFQDGHSCYFIYDFLSFPAAHVGGDELFLGHHGGKPFVPEGVGNIREGFGKFFCEGLCPFHPDALCAVHVERQADDEFFHLVLVGELPEPFEIRFPGGMADGFQALGGPAEEVAHRHAEGDGAYVKTHDPHIRGPCA